MKRLILGIFLSLEFLINSYAQEIDLISLATNGKYNEQSKGVKVLNDEEMRRVVGGYRPFSASWYANTYIKNPISNNYNANTGPQTNNQAIYSNAFMKYYKPLKFCFGKTKC